MQSSKNHIKTIAQKYSTKATVIRKHLHAYPELANQEFKTSAYIREELDQLKLPYTFGHAQTGIVATLKCRNPKKKTVAIRADMDALPIAEQTGLEYTSKHSGCMHACGHDLHMASVLGVAMIAKELKKELEGTILFIFQPAEEKVPGGAIKMLEEGAINPKPDVMIGQHVMPSLPVGKVAFRDGITMASADEIYITIHGIGGHAAQPHTLVDPIAIGAEIIQSLQQVVSRKANPAIPTVLSFGKFMASGATNVIPDEAKMEGSLRTMDETWRFQAHDIIRKRVAYIAKISGAEATVDIKVGYPMLMNDVHIVKQARKYARILLGDKQVLPLDIEMTAEDFAYYAQEFPSVFYRLGTGGEEPYGYPLHSSQFNIHPTALLTSIETLAWLVISFLKG